MAEQCQNCLYDSDHPFGLTVQDGLCSGCRTHAEKDQLDWPSREKLLETRLRSVRKSRRKNYYDCIVPVVGDAEDYYVVSRVLDLDLHPLIVCVNDYFKNDIGWHNLHNLITVFDLDSLVYNPDFPVYQELVRTSLRKNHHILWPFLALHSSFPVHIAKERDIPLVIWGQHQAIEQVGKFSHCDEVEMSEWSRIEHDLFRQDIDKVIGNGAQVDTRKLNNYRYPAIESLARSGVTGIYLSNYFRWDPYTQNRAMMGMGFTPQENHSSFDTYERAGSSVYYQVHDLMKQKRTGYRKVRDHLVREIRHGRMTRDQAVVLEREYSQVRINPDHFLAWLGVSSTGKEWLKLHLFDDVVNLLGEPENPGVSRLLPAAVSELHSSGNRPARNFITFGKGI